MNLISDSKACKMPLFCYQCDRLIRPLLVFLSGPLDAGTLLFGAGNNSKPFLYRIYNRQNIPHTLKQPDACHITGELLVFYAKGRL